MDRVLVVHRAIHNIRGYRRFLYHSARISNPREPTWLRLCRPWGRILVQPSVLLRLSDLPLAPLLRMNTDACHGPLAWTCCGSSFLRRLGGHPVSSDRWIACFIGSVSFCTRTRSHRPSCQPLSRTQRELASMNMTEILPDIGRVFQ